MANAAELRLVLNAVDNASAKINGVTGSVSKLGKASKAGGDLLAGMGIGISSMINPAMLAGQVIGKMGDFVKDAATETVAYNKTIREMTQVTGLGAEEISRIVQVGDDWGISIDAIRTSLAFMNKTGVTPSIANLTDLADEYVNTTDKSAFAEKAVKLLGRGYQTLIPLLALGGKGLRDATGAVEDNLIATDESIKATREYEVNVDKLTDAWTGFKHEVGNSVIPILNEVLGGLNNQRDVTKELKKALDDGIISQKEYAEGLRDLRTGGDDYLETLQKIESSSLSFTGTENSLTTATNDLTGATNDLTSATQNAAMAIYDLDQKAFANEAIRALNQAFEDGAISEDVYRVKMVQMMDQMLGMDDQSIESTLKMADLKKELDSGQITAAQYADEVKRLYNNLKDLDGTTVTTHVTTVYDERGHGRHEAGLNFTIPPGYPNDSFPLGSLGYAQSGEKVIIQPASNTTNNNQQYHLHTNAGGNVRRDFNMMKALAG